MKVNMGTKRGNLRTCFSWFLNRLSGVMPEEYEYWTAHFSNEADCRPGSPPEAPISPHLELNSGDSFWTGSWQEGLDWWERYLLAVHHGGRPQLFQFRVRQSWFKNKETGKRGYSIEVLPPALACKSATDLEEAWIEAEMMACLLVSRISQPEASHQEPSED